jgi:hypothetical protein
VFGTLVVCLPVRFRGGGLVLHHGSIRAAAGAPIRRQPTASEADLEAEFAAALANPRFLPSGGLLGIPCTHLYATASGRAPFAGTLSKARASRLKGRDRLVALAALRAGLRARFRPYLFETCGDESWRLTRARQIVNGGSSEGGDWGHSNFRRPCRSSTTPTGTRTMM